MVANSDGDGVFDREFFRGRPDSLSSERTILYWNEEFRSTLWGHLTLLNLKRLVEPIFTGFFNTTHPHDYPTNAVIADHVHDQGGHVNYTHPAQNVRDPYLSAYSAKALPVDAALGKVDSIDVLGSHHEANLPLWYRLLNCGFRLSASAGTDCFLNRIPGRLPGEDRVYVKVEGTFDYPRWIRALRAGRTFVTNGPMLEFSVEDQLPGGIVQLEQPGEIRIQGRVVSQYLLDRMEIVYNARSVFSVPLEGGLRASFETRLPALHTGWVALRASGPPHPDQPRGTLFAHSGPVYLQIRGNPVKAREDAAYFLHWIDRLEQDLQARQRVPSRHRGEVEEQLSRARAVFRSLAQDTPAP